MPNCGFFVRKILHVWVLGLLGFCGVKFRCLHISTFITGVLNVSRCKFPICLSAVGSVNKTLAQTQLLYATARLIMNPLYF